MPHSKKCQPISLRETASAAGQGWGGQKPSVICVPVRHVSPCASVRSCAPTPSRAHPLPEPWLDIVRDGLPRAGLGSASPPGPVNPGQRPGVSEYLVSLLGSPGWKRRDNAGQMFLHVHDLPVQCLSSASDVCGSGLCAPNTVNQQALGDQRTWVLARGTV